MNIEIQYTMVMWNVTTMMQLYGCQWYLYTDENIISGLRLKGNIWYYAFL